MMNTIDFLHEYIDDKATYSDYKTEAKKKLSIQLAGSFEFYKTELLGETVMFLKPTDKYTAGKIQKWMSLIEEKLDIPVAVIMDDLTPYMIKKMLMEHIAFVVPGKQISLPFLAMHIKSLKKKETKNIRKFAPATQLIYLYILYSEKTDFEIEEIAELLNVSSMTAVRGMGDLTELGVITYDIAGQTGRKKIFHKTDKREYYSIGKKYIDNPVRDIVYISEIPDGVELIKADLTALAEQTMLDEPQQKRYALYYRDKSLIEDYIIEKERAEEEQCPMLQLFKYDVKKVTENGCVDPISMIAGLTDSDERIEMCIEELMEDKKWYEE